MNSLGLPTVKKPSSTRTVPVCVRVTMWWAESHAAHPLHGRDPAATDPASAHGKPKTWRKKTINWTTFRQIRILQCQFSRGTKQRNNGSTAVDCHVKTAGFLLDHCTLSRVASLEKPQAPIHVRKRSVFPRVGVVCFAV